MVGERLNYTEDSLKKALQAIANGMPIRAASKTYGVPYTTLACKHRGIYPVGKKPGPATVLSMHEEHLLKEWIITVAKRGFPVTKLQLIDSVQLLLKHLKRETVFPDNRPGRHWYEGFLRRHPELSQRMAQNLTQRRANVSENSVREWFDEVKEYLVSKNLQDIESNRVFNCDETAFCFSPKDQKVIVKKGEKTVHTVINNNEKEGLTTLITVNAAGDLAPPFVIFPYKRIPYHIFKNVPGEWGVGKSDNGWMTGETFYEFVVNIFYPWVLKMSISFPIVLFVDGHASHLTLPLSNFCSEHKIELIALFPNSTHFLQPLDVALFRPLKCSWKRVVHKWRVDNNGNRLRREDFAPLLRDAIDSLNLKNIIPNGFKTCGLHPFDKNAINFDKLINKNAVSNTVASRSKSEYENHLKFLEEMLDPNILETFHRCKNSCNHWNGNEEDKNLYNIWRKVKNLAEGCCDENQEIVSSLNLNIENLPVVIEENDGTTYKLNENGYLEIESFVVNDFENMPSLASTNSNLDHLLDERDDINKGSNMEISITQNSTDQVIEKTPTKNDDNNNEIPENIPTPFKKALFWPQKNVTATKRKPKEKIPSVATSEQWQSYYVQKEQKKIDEDAAKEARKRKKLNVEKGSKEKRKSNNNNNSNNDKNLDLSSIEKCSFVIVKYDNTYYPGQVIDIDNNVDGDEYFIKVMTKSATNNWKWPTPEDVLWYKKDSIIIKIKEPQSVNNRGQYNVPEMATYL